MITCLFLLLLLPLLKGCTLFDYTLEVNLPGCNNKIYSIATKGCRGQCESDMVPSIYPPYYKQNCKCCSQAEFKTVEYKIKCRRKKYRTVIISSAKSCVCRKCEEQFDPVHSSRRVKRSPDWDLLDSERYNSSSNSTMRRSKEPEIVNVSDLFL